MIMLLYICLQDPRFYYVYNSIWKLHMYEVVLLLYVFVYNIVVCIYILFNNKMLLSFEYKYKENRFKVVVFYVPAPRPSGVHRPFGLSVRPYVDRVNIFVQGRISRPINGSKFIFNMSMYLYETSRNIQKPWPHDLYFMVHWLRTLARLSRLRFLSKVES